MSKPNSPDSKPWWAIGCTGDLSPSDLQRFKSTQILLLVWLATFGAATLLLTRGEIESAALRYALATVPSLLLIGAIVSYGRFLARADELTRRIQAESMAVGFAVGIVLVLAMSLFERAGTPGIEGDDALMAMVIAFVLAVVYRQRQYR